MFQPFSLTGATWESDVPLVSVSKNPKEPTRRYDPARMRVRVMRWAIGQLHFALVEPMHLYAELNSVPWQNAPIDITIYRRMVMHDLNPLGLDIWVPQAILQVTRDVLDAAGRPTLLFRQQDGQVDDSALPDALVHDAFEKICLSLREEDKGFQDAELRPIPDAKVPKGTPLPMQHMDKNKRVRAQLEEQAKAAGLVPGEPAPDVAEPLAAAAVLPDVPDDVPAAPEEMVDP